MTKRFVDLLAQGVEFIKDFEGDIWKYDTMGNTFVWDVAGRVWCKLGVEIEMFNPATRAENPEKPVEKKVKKLYRWTIQSRITGAVLDTTHYQADEKGVQQDWGIDYRILRRIDETAIEVPA